MADGHAIGMVKLHTHSGQFIEVRCLVGLASVTLDNFLPNIISKDKRMLGRSAARTQTTDKIEKVNRVFFIV